jgi:hypothetical protein
MGRKRRASASRWKSKRAEAVARGGRVAAVSRIYSSVPFHAIARHAAVTCLTPDRAAVGRHWMKSPRLPPQPVLTARRQAGKTNENHSQLLVRGALASSRGGIYLALAGGRDELDRHVGMRTRTGSIKDGESIGKALRSSLGRRLVLGHRLRSQRGSRVPRRRDPGRDGRARRGLRHLRPAEAEGAAVAPRAIHGRPPLLGAVFFWGGITASHGYLERVLPFAGVVDLRLTGRDGFGILIENLSQRA